MTIQENRTPEQIEVSVEETQEQINKIAEFLEYTLNSKVDSDLKREIINRLNKELEWLEDIKQDEEGELIHQEHLIDLAIKSEIEDRKLKEEKC